MNNVVVLDEHNRVISKTSSAMARKMLRKNEAIIVSRDPFMICLTKAQKFGGTKMETADLYKIFIGTEQPLYIQNVSGGRISFEFNSHGQVIPFRMLNSRDPKCLNNELPWDLMKNDARFRKLLTNEKLVRVMDQKDYEIYLGRRSTLLKTSKKELIESAETKHDSYRMNEITPPTREELNQQLRDEVKNPDVIINEVEEINGKILGVCQQLHPESDSKIDPIDALDVFESMVEITAPELDYIRGHCYNDIIKKWALHKQIEITGGEDGDIEVETLAKSETIEREIDDQSAIAPTVKKAAKKKAPKKKDPKKKK